MRGIYSGFWFPVSKGFLPIESILTSFDCFQPFIGRVFMNQAGLSIKLWKGVSDE